MEDHWNVSNGPCYAKERYSVGMGEDQRAVGRGTRVGTTRRGSTSDSVEEGVEREETRSMESLDFSPHPHI